MNNVKFTSSEILWAKVIVDKEVRELKEMLDVPGLKKMHDELKEVGDKLSWVLDRSKTFSEIEIVVKEK